MAVDTSSPPQSVTELNACVTTSSHRPVKDTTFREWVVSNQIGMDEFLQARAFFFFLFPFFLFLPSYLVGLLYTNRGFYSLI